MYSFLDNLTGNVLLVSIPLIVIVFIYQFGASLLNPKWLVFKMSFYSRCLGKTAL